jgi:hypothetical protein
MKKEKIIKKIEKIYKIINKKNFRSRNNDVLVLVVFLTLLLQHPVLVLVFKQ